MTSTSTQTSTQSFIRTLPSSPNHSTSFLRTESDRVVLLHKWQVYASEFAPIHSMQGLNRVAHLALTQSRTLFSADDQSALLHTDMSALSIRLVQMHILNFLSESNLSDTLLIHIPFSTQLDVDLHQSLMEVKHSKKVRERIMIVIDSDCLRSKLGVEQATQLKQAGFKLGIVRAKANLVYRKIEPLQFDCHLMSLTDWPTDIKEQKKLIHQSQGQLMVYGVSCLATRIELHHSGVDLTCDALLNT